MSQSKLTPEAQQILAQLFQKYKPQIRNLGGEIQEAIQSLVISLLQEQAEIIVTLQKQLKDTNPVPTKIPESKIVPPPVQNNKKK